MAPCSQGGAHRRDTEQALAGEVYRTVLAAREDEPGSPVMRGLDAVEARRAFAIARRGVTHEDEADLVEDVAGGVVDAHLARRGLRLDEEQRGRVSRAVAQAVHQAAEILAQRADGDWTPDPKASRFPPIETIDVLDWRVEFARYVRLQPPKPKTVRSFEKRIGELMARVGSNDLRKITPKHVDDWASDLLIAGLDPLTVRDGYLAAVKRICSFVRLKLPVNPAVGITVPVQRKEKVRDNGFTIAEARSILRGALEPASNRLSPDRLWNGVE